LQEKQKIEQHVIQICNYKPYKTNLMKKEIKVFMVDAPEDETYQLKLSKHPSGQGRRGYQ